MPATASANKRIRQIAILLSSVDSTTARQLLLHLPTETARQVRAMAGKLGPISPEEKRRILADFQRTATTNASTHPATPRETDTYTSQAADDRDVYRTGTDRSDLLREDSPVGHHGDASYREPDDGTQLTETKWGSLNADGLLKFLRGERSAVIAVVVSQLPPKLAVQVLQDLPRETNREVLQRMAGLGEIDADALSSIEDYLSERLAEYQKTVRSETENQKRMDALLAAAPMALREQWQSVLDGTENEAPEKQKPAPDPQPVYESPEAGFSDAATLAAEQTEDTLELQQANILPFPGQVEETASTTGELAPIDSSLIRLEFESLLEKPPEILARILSEPASQTVLLALAGATPSFMQRFYEMLRPEDAAALKTRLSDIGAINLRDIDAAQQELIEFAVELGHHPAASSAPSPSMRRQAA